MTILRRGSWVAMVLVVFATACAGERHEDDEGDGNFETGIPGSKRLSDLSDSELERLCDEIEEFAESPAVSETSHEYACRLGGMVGALFADPMTDAEARAACAEVYDECRASGGSSMTTCNRPSASCTATVAEYEACMADIPGYLEATLAVIPTCETLTLASLEEDPADAPEYPASCALVEEKCPDDEL